MWQAPSKEKTEFPPLQSVSNATPTELVQSKTVNDNSMPLIPETALVRFDVQAATMQEIKKYQLIKVNIDDPETVKLAKKAKSVTRELRLKIQRRQKKVNAEINQQKKDLKADATSLTSEIKATEDHLAKEIQKDIDHKAKLKEEQRIIDEARMATIKKNMGILQGYCEAGLKPGIPSEEIQSALRTLENSAPPKGIFQEEFQTACNLYNHGLEATRAALAKRKAWEEAEEKRKEEAAMLQRQSEINNQQAWFNDVFGWGGTPEGMEDGLIRLSEMTPPAHLSDLIEDQKIRAQKIIVKARGVKAEADRVATEKAELAADAKKAEEKEKARRIKEETDRAEKQAKEFNLDFDTALEMHHAWILEHEMPLATTMNKDFDKKRLAAMEEEERRQIDVKACKSAYDTLEKSMALAIGTVSETTALPEFTQAIEDFSHNLDIGLQQLKERIWSMK